MSLKDWALVIILVMVLFVMVQILLLCKLHRKGSCNATVLFLSFSFRFCLNSTYCQVTKEIATW